MRRLLVLRPEPGSSKTVARATALGLGAVAIPLFEIEPIAWDCPDASAFDGLLLTSANAARHGGRQLRRLDGLPVYAVGEATAAAARECGLKIAAVGEFGVEELLKSIDPALRLLHPCGEDLHVPTDHRRRIASLPVYRAKVMKTPRLGAAAGAVALIHSPRAGHRFAELVEDRTSIAIAAISDAAAQAVGSGWQIVEAADRPSDDALLALAARLCNNSPPK
jgi:uroporphyrinogen-III synthase